MCAAGVASNAANNSNGDTEHKQKERKIDPTYEIQTMETRIDRAVKQRS
jgi:hypothetical protein